MAYHKTINEPWNTSFNRKESKSSTKHNSHQPGSLLGLWCYAWIIGGLIAVLLPELATK